MFGASQTSKFDNTPLGQAAKAAAEDAKKNRPLPQVRGKTINGVLYVRAEDIADALDTLAPTANKPLIDKLRRKK
jgi:hypothetical protein